MRHVWNSIHSRTFDKTTLETLKQLFPRTDEERAEDYSCPRLHRIILGYSFSKLGEELAVGGLDVNELDFRGYTPLIWAVRRKDNEAVELLLKARADPNLLTPTGSSALHFAAWTGNLACVKMLLNFGSKIGQVNANGTNALMFAAINSSNLEMLEVLASVGIDVLNRNTFGKVALHCTVTFDEGSSALKTKLLLDLGANVNAQDNEGDTPLHDSLRQLVNSATEVLLRHGADYTIINNQGNTILHEAARFGNLETLSILRTANLTNIDPYAVSSDKKTPLQIAQRRDPMPEGFIDLFQLLMFEIRNRNDNLKR